MDIKHVIRSIDWSGKSIWLLITWQYFVNLIGDLDNQINADVNQAIGAVSSIGKTAVGAIGSAIKKITRRCVIS